MTNASPSPTTPAINAPASAQTASGPLGAEVALALKIESNACGRQWAEDLRRRLQERNTEVTDVCDALLTAIRRVEVANSEGDPILSGWLPDARAALARLAPAGEVAGAPADQGHQQDSKSTDEESEDSAAHKRLKAIHAAMTEVLVARGSESVARSADGAYSYFLVRVDGETTLACAPDNLTNRGFYAREMVFCVDIPGGGLGADDINQTADALDHWLRAPLFGELSQEERQDIDAVMAA